MVLRMIVRRTLVKGGRNAEAEEGGATQDRQGVEFSEEEGHHERGLE